MCDKMTAMEPTTGGGSLPSQWTGFPEYIGREVAPMTAYEIISIFIGILALLMSFGSLVIALLAFLDKKNKRKSVPPGEHPKVCVNLQTDVR